MRKFLLYLMVLTMPLALGFSVAQSARWSDLRKDVRSLAGQQEEIIEQNKKLLTDIASLSSPQRIEKIARDEMGLTPVKPEDVMQVRIGN
jgi:cell division protein FtsL